mmetsp:Transcript_10113/g.15443  ORF Transcript_10113/g.15443 Transcript_10113/m.15443 type:complete len:158 (-) Transcript_10113:441-914(-)
MNLAKNLDADCEEEARKNLRNRLLAKLSYYYNPKLLYEAVYLINYYELPMEEELARQCKLYCDSDQRRFLDIIIGNHTYLAPALRRRVVKELIELLSKDKELFKNKDYILKLIQLHNLSVSEFSRINEFCQSSVVLQLLKKGHSYLKVEELVSGNHF